MTGLDLSNDELVEVAVIVTDYNLTVLDPGFHVVIKPSSRALENMGDFVQEMHTSSGLLEEIPGGVTLAEAEVQILDYITRFVPDPGVAPLAGNTIGTDRSFIAKELPSVNAHLHYRNIDVSTIKELAKHWFPKSYFNSPEKRGGHRALADITESLRELAYYRRAVFVEQPGPDTASAKKIKDAITEQWASPL